MAGSRRTPREDQRHAPQRLDRASLIAPLSPLGAARAQIATSTTGIPPLYAAGAVKHTVEELRDGLRAAERPVPDALYDMVGALCDRILAGDRLAVTLERLGLREELRPKLRLVPFGIEGITLAGRREVALAFSQATEIIRPARRAAGRAAAGRDPSPDRLSRRRGARWGVSRAVSISPAAAARAARVRRTSAHSPSHASPRARPVRSSRPARRGGKR